MNQTITNIPSNFKINSYSIKELFTIIERLTFVGLCSYNPVIAYTLLSYITYSKGLYAKYKNTHMLSSFYKIFKINQHTSFISKCSNFYILKK